MDRAGNKTTDAPYHRGNYKFRYTPDEEAHVYQFASRWMPTKGLLSAVVGGGITYSLMRSGVVAAKHRNLKIGAGAFLSFTIARVLAMREMHKELREKYPDGYSAQMYYLRHNSEAFQDYISFARENQRLGVSQPRSERFSRIPPQPVSRNPPASDNKPAPVSTDVPGSHSPPAGLDDRFRPQMDGILQGQHPPEDDDNAKKDPKGSYAMWRAQKPPQSSDPPKYRPPSQSPQYDTFQNPSSYESTPKQPVRQDPPPPKRPVKRNKYGDIIDDE